MIIKTDKESNILYIESDGYQKCSNGDCIYLCKSEIIGKVDSLLRISEYSNDDFYKLLSSEEISEGYLSELIGSYGLIKIKDNKLIYAGTDLCALERLYQYKDGDITYIFSDVYDFFAGNYVTSFKLNYLRYEYYLSHGYNRGENTYVEGLIKLSPGLLYYSSGKKIDLLDTFHIERACDYSCYKDVVTNIIKLLCKDKKTYIMHSGGVDSNLLLCVAQSLGADIELITYEYCAPNQMDTNLADVERSRRIAEDRKVKHNIVSMKFDNYEEYLKNTGLFRKMPFEAHKTSGAVYNLFKTLEKQHKSSDYIVLCGQNNDSLYNLGPTELFTCNLFKIKNFKRGLQGVCQRILISNIYVKAICKGQKIRKNLIDSLVKTVFYLRYKEKYEPASNCSELVNYFLNSSCYFAMKEKNDNYEMVEYNGVTEENFRKVIFKEKLRSFVDGNDNKVITACADLNNVKVYLPYSLQPLIYFYYNMSMNNRDIFYPKDMCYRIVKEHGMEIKTFKSKYKSNVDKGLQWDNKLKMEFSTNESELNFQQVIGKRWSQGIVANTIVKKEGK
ncbi:MAG: 7-cyano-7-deazaguanine synthase [Eubacterium sp.]